MKLCSLVLEFNPPLVMLEREIHMLLTMCISYCCSFTLKMSKVLFYLIQQTSDHILFPGIQLKRFSMCDRSKMISSQIWRTIKHVFVTFTDIKSIVASDVYSFVTLHGERVCSLSVEPSGI